MHESKLETETEKQKQIHTKLLKESKELVGPLYPCIKEKGGKILSGMHRKEADPNWPEKEIEVKDAKHRLRIIVHSNIQRIIPEAEKQNWITQAREILQSEGKKGTQKEIAELLGYSQGWVSFYDPVEHQVHPPKKVLTRNTFSPPHKPEFIPPKIRLEPEEQKPEDLKKKLFEKCPFCDISFDYLKSFSLDEQLKLQKQHIDIHTAKPEKEKQEKKPSIQKDISITPKEPSAKEILEYFDKDKLVRATILSVWKHSKCDKGNCGECEISDNCVKAMSYLPIRITS